MRIRKICFITDGYPSETRVVNAFVETLVNTLVDSGMDCVVIAPQSITKTIKTKEKLELSFRERVTTSGKKVPVYTPKYISVSAKRIGKLNTADITFLNFKRAALRVFKKLNAKENFDAVYGHFIWPAGIVANYLGKKYRIPSFLAYGENGTYSIEYFGRKKTAALMEGISGVVSVSSENKRVLVENQIAEESRIGVFPNACDNRLFYPRDKKEMREKYKLPQDAFIIAFVGRFLDVKGPDRLDKAIALLEEDRIKAFYIGTGPLKPTGPGVLFATQIPHESLGEYLSAADIFVLPTLAEGCCNAIVEALACGLPVVSSNASFNDDILDESCSIRVNSDSVEEISEAIKRLYSDADLRRRLEQGARQKGQTLSIQQRAERIKSFINKKAEEDSHEN